MKNRAKCLKCYSIVESFHSGDYVRCSCGAIAVDGGDAMRCYADDWNDFVRVDEEGNEVVVKVVEEKESDLERLRDYVIRLREMPEEAKTMAVSHQDLEACLTLVYNALLGP